MLWSKETLLQISSAVDLEASVLSEYEERLVRRRREVRELQEQRDRLLDTQRKLQQLQQNITDSVRHTPLYTLGL